MILRQHKEARHLRAGSDETGDRRRRALIDIRRPEMKRRRRHFEGEAGQSHDQRGITNRLDRLCSQFFGNRSELKFAGQAIEEADAKQRERRRHAAEEKVFQGRLGRRQAGLVKGRQDIKRDAEHFEGDENDQ